MSKFRTSILILSLLVIVVAASLLTVFGLYLTGAVVTERIELTLKVADAKKEYDGTPLVADAYEIVAGELQEGHYAVVEYLGSQTDATEDGKEGESSLAVKICNKKGHDVTDEYAINVESGRLEVTKRKIFVSLEDQSVIYNGTQVTFEDYKVDGELVEGHRVVGSRDGKLINIWDEIPDLKPLVVDAAGKDVTKNYEIGDNFAEVNIKVVPRPIKVKPKNWTKTYDGIEITKIELEQLDILSGSLVDGQYFKNIEINNGGERPRDVCDITTRVTEIHIYQREGSGEVDVTENYDINYDETGIVRIDPRALTITAKSASWEYDGLEHMISEEDAEPLSCVGLAPGEMLESVKYSVTIKNAGSVDNTIALEDIRLIDSEEQNASRDNYKIEVIAGKLTVTRREITIITPTIMEEYSGEEIKGVSEKFQPSGIHLLDGDIKHILTFDIEKVPTRALYGSTPNQFECRIVDAADPDDDVTANYHITYNYGEIRISKRTARVTTGSPNRPYNGEPLYGYVEGDAIDTDNLIEGHYVQPRAGVELPNSTDVAKIPNNYKVTVFDRDGNDVSDNYEIQYTYGTLEVTPYKLTVKLSDYKYIYDSNAFAIDEDVALDGNDLPEFLQASDFVLVLPQETFTDAGTYSYSARIKDDAKAVNFDITYTGGAIVIEKCVVLVELAPFDVTYSNTTWTGPDDLAKAITISGVGESTVDHLTAVPFKNLFRIVPQGVIKNVGSYTYTVKFLDAADEKNHTLVIDDAGRVTVSKYVFGENLLTVDTQYNGEDQMPKSVEQALNGKALPNGLTNDDFEVVAVSGAIVDASDRPYYYTLQLKNPLEAENYLITARGTVTIGRREVRINLFSNDNVPYNGASHLPAVGDAILNANELPAYLQAVDKKFVVSATLGDMTNVGTHIYTVSFKNAADESNHDLTIMDDGLIVITPRDVRVTLKDRNDVTYDGREHMPDWRDVTVVCDGAFVTEANLNSYYEFYTSSVMREANDYRYGLRPVNNANAKNFNFIIQNIDGTANYGIYTINRVKVSLANSVNAETDRNLKTSKSYDGTVFALDTAYAIAHNYVRLTSETDLSALMTRFTLACVTESADADAYDVLFSDLHIFNSYGDDIVRNFELTENSTVSIVIEKLAVTLTLDNYYCSSAEGLPTVSAAYAECLRVLSSTPLPDKFYLSFVAESILNLNGKLMFDDFENVKIMNAAGDDMTKNFIITNEDLLMSDVIAMKQN